MLNNIVVALDGSNYSWCAAHHALQIAKLCGATIHGVSVTDVKIIEGKLLDDLTKIVTRLNVHVGPIPDGKTDNSTPESVHIDPATIQSLYHDQGKLLLDQLERECQAVGVNFKPGLTEGFIPSVICQTAKDLNAELIVMGKRGINAKWGGPLLGSTAESVVRLARRPVLLAQETYTSVSGVYVAYDGELLSVRALRFSAELCKACGWQMRVISVEDAQEQQEKLLREAAEVADLHNLKITPIGRSGGVVENILEGAAEDSAAPIVLGARSRRLLGLSLGNISERVMWRAAQPVLLYRPLTEA